MKKLLTVFLTFLVILPLISSAPPITNVNTEQGLEIFYPQFEAVKQDVGFNLNIQVSNITNGFPLLNTGVSCKLHLYDLAGNHTFESGILDKDGNGYDHSVFINGGNFSDEGQHAFYIWCNTTNFGGEVKGTFQVNKTGVIPDGIVIVLFSLLFIIVCFELLGLLLWTILHFIELNLDAKDLILNVSSYFALFAVYVLQLRFVGDVFMSDFLLFLLEMGAVTTVLIPIIGFAVSFIKQNMKTGDYNNG